MENYQRMIQPLNGKNYPLEVIVPLLLLQTEPWTKLSFISEPQLGWFNLETAFFSYSEMSKLMEVIGFALV